MLLEILWSTLLALSIVPFGLYLLYMGRIAKKVPWNIKLDYSYEPTLSVVIPTYEEASSIEAKLDNLTKVNYPKQKIEIIIVDSASRDATVDIAESWSKKHTNLRLRIIRQAVRKGMVNALIEGLKNATGEVFLKTDVDCLLFPDSIKCALKYLSDPSVGSVAGLHQIVSKRNTAATKAEKNYREFYKILRIGESKLYGTVLYEGELMLIKRDLLNRIGFDEDIGGDDVAIAIKLASFGYRAITAEDAFFIEKAPYTWKERINQKTRRARHVFQAIWKYKYLINAKNTIFHKLILPFETYIYVINPFFVFFLIIASIPFILSYPWVLLFSTLLIHNRVRTMFVTFLSNNLIMLGAILLEIRKREPMTWKKISEIRE